MDVEFGLLDAAEMELAQECVRLKARVGEVRQRAERLRVLAAHLEERAHEEEASLIQLEGVLGLAAQLQLDQLDGELGGRRLQEIAIQVLAREIRPGQAIHYRDWYTLLQAAGYRARGKNPLASFLAQINRAERVEQVGSRTGRYRLRAA